MPSVSFKNTLTSRALRREAIQLGVAALLVAVPVLLDSRALQVLAGIAAAAMCTVTAVAFVVAWRVSGRPAGLALYGASTVVFAALAVLNLRG